MSTYELLVVGSGPAGVSAAASYAEAGGEGPIAVLTADVDAPYMRPPLSKDELQNAGEVEPTPIGPELPEGTDLRLGTRVTAIDAEARTVTAGGEELSFERLVLAPGASPTPFPDADDDAEVYQLRSLDDARRLDAAARRSSTAVVIGSGFIGCEAAASLAVRGLEVTLVTPDVGPQHKRLGDYVCAQMTTWLTVLGVRLRTGVRVTRIEAPRTVHLDDGHTLAPDMILAATGITPAAEDLAGSTGLQTHEGRVVVDEYLSAGPGVWAAGDCARALNVAAGRPLAVEHWGDALTMGELAGRNAAGVGAQEAWDAVPGFFSEIGEHTIKYAAWGDGHETAEVIERTGGFTVWYADATETVVGVLTYNADDDYERGSGLVRAGSSLTEARSGARAPSSEEMGDT